MTEKQDSHSGIASWGKSRIASWGKAVCVHLGIVGLSLVLSLLLLQDIIPFDPEGTCITAAVFGILHWHKIAAGVSLFLPKFSIKSCGLVFCIAFFFTGGRVVEAVQKWMNREARINKGIKLNFTPKISGVTLSEESNL